MKSLKLFAIISTISISYFTHTADAQGNARQDKGNHSGYVAPPSNHRKEYVAPPSSVPRGAKAIRYDNRSYYWHNGNCYYNNVIVRPPYGLVVPSIPSYFIEIKYRGKKYYYYSGNFYLKYRNGYQVIEPVVGLVITELPRGYVIINHRGVKYYKVNGIYYRAVNDRRHNSYEVIGRRLP